MTLSSDAPSTYDIPCARCRYNLRTKRRSEKCLSMLECVGAKVDYFAVSTGKFNFLSALRRQAGASLPQVIT